MMDWAHGKDETDNECIQNVWRDDNIRMNFRDRCEDGRWKKLAEN
jgi:hypothetical protein